MAVILENSNSHDVPIPDDFWSTYDDIPSNSMEDSWNDEISDMASIRPKQTCACEGKQIIKY